MRRTLDGLNIRGFAGENVQKYVGSARPLAQELITANEWVSQSTILILKVFASVSVTYPSSRFLSPKTSTRPNEALSSPGKVYS